MMAQISKPRGGQKPCISRAAFFGIRPGARSIVVASALLILAGALGGCDDAPTTPEDFLTRAEQSREAGDLSASNIDLKNALQADPMNARARRLMGLNYLDMGAWRAAETTLERAQNDGAAPLLIMRPLARVKLALGKPDQALKLTQLSDDMQASLQADLLVLRGRALVSQREREDGRKAFEDALKQDQSSYGAYLGLAGLAVADKKTDEADKLFAKAAAIAPENSDVLMFQGAYARFKEDHKAAEAAYRKLVTRRPGRVDYRVGLAQAQLATKNHEGAIETLAPVLKAVPNHPSLNYYRALAAYQAKDYQTVTVHTENVLKFDRGNLPTILISGAARFALKQYERAANDLERFVSQVPNHRLARRLLGAAQLQLQRPEEALNTLKPIAEKDDADAGLLSLIGTAAMRARDLKEGAGYFERVVKLRPENAKARAQLGLSRIAIGEVDGGIDQLIKAVEKDPAFRRADLVLIFNLLRAKRFKEALAAAQEIQSKRPKDVSGYSFAGLAQMALKDDAAAKTSFEMALKLVPGKPDASNNLASFALKNKQIDKAVNYLNDVLKHYPSHIGTLLRLSRLEMQRGNSDRAGKLLSKAVEAKPNSLLPRTLLGRFQLTSGDPRKALITVQPALRRYRNDPALLEVAGKAYLAIRAFSDAVSMLQRLVELRPDLAETHFLLARAYAGTRDSKKIKTELKAALRIDNKHLGSRLSLARLLITTGQLDDAEKQLADLKNAFPKSSVVIALEGDYLLARGEPLEASKAFQAALKMGASAQLTIKLARANWIANEPAKAVSTLEGWIRNNPAGIGTRLQLATYYSALRRDSDAATQYRLVITRMPNNWVPRNELAWLLLMSGEIKSALSQIKKAREISPGNPIVLDTMALILLEQGKTNQAVGLLQQASKLSPRNPEIGYHLAQAILKDGDRDEAHRVLKNALSNEAGFTDRESAESLLKELGG